MPRASSTTNNYQCRKPIYALGLGLSDWNDCSMTWWSYLDSRDDCDWVLAQNGSQNPMEIRNQFAQEIIHMTRLISINHFYIINESLV